MSNGLIQISTVHKQGRCREPHKIKCVVWDLDNTLWSGVLLEDRQVVLRPGAVEAIETLDRRGILQSVASRTSFEDADAKLRELGLRDYFLYPQMNWNDKSSSVKAIAEGLNLGLDSLALVDDQAYEREEVNFRYPEVLCIDAQNLDNILDLSELIPEFVTEESGYRRKMYFTENVRKQAEGEFAGPQEDFLMTLGMKLTIASATEKDLRRAEELTARTNQLNTTGRSYSLEELDQLRCSDQHQLLMASLEDRFGPYGKIGLGLVESLDDVWTIRLLLMSCRVMSRGVGGILLNHIMARAAAEGARLRADFVHNQRNRMMYVTLKFAGFKEVAQVDGHIILENKLSHIPSCPEYVDLTVHP